MLTYLNPQKIDPAYPLSVLTMREDLNSKFGGTRCRVDSIRFDSMRSLTLTEFHIDPGVLHLPSDNVEIKFVEQDKTL